MRGLVPLIIIAGIGYWVYHASRPAFSDRDVIALQDDIRTQFEKRDGVKVTDVSSLRESDRRLVGYAKLRIDGLKEEISKDCTATMSDTDGSSMWSCR